MTTLEEISSNEQANFEYWTDRAKFRLMLYRERKDFNMHPAFIAQAKAAFRQSMKGRRDKEFLNI